MKAQALYDKVARHLLAQGRTAMRLLKSSDNIPSCAYRGKKGLVCAAGATLPDALYHPEFEGSSIENLLERAARPAKADPLPSWREPMGPLTAASRRDLNKWFKLVGKDNLRLLMRLQDAHDRMDTTSWKRSKKARKTLIGYLEEIARDFNLETTVLDGQ